MLQKLLKSTNKENFLIAYKLLYDFLILWLAFFVFALIAEGLITNIVSSHIGLYIIAIILFVNIILINFLSEYLHIKDRSALNKKIAGLLFFICALLLFNSLIKLNIFLNFFLLVTIFVIIYFLLQVFQEKD